MKTLLDLPTTAVVLALAFFNVQLAAQEEIPPGPPWTDTCSDLDATSFPAIFTSASCQNDFTAVFERETVPQIHQWMIGNSSCFKEWAHFTWLAVASNDSKMAELAWRHQLYIGNERLGEDVNALLLRGSTGVIGDEAKIHTGAFLDAVEKNTAFDDEMAKAYDAVTPVCLYHGSFSCIGAMNKILDWMYPRSYKRGGLPVENMTFSMVPFYREVFSDTLTQQYASKFALQLLRIIDSGDFQRQNVKLDNLYTMGLEFFSGDIDRFWNFMIVYSTRGAAWATGSQMVSGDNKPVFAAMLVISAAMGVLDTQYSKDGSAWSYGASGANSCYQPKPYHFWMAGGFSYLLKKHDYSEETSQLVARLLGALYELGSKTMGRDPDSVFFVPTFHANVNRARREINHHFLGAEFGVKNSQTKPQDFDQTFLEIMQASRALPDISDEEMRDVIKDAPTKWNYWADLTGYYFK